MYEKKQVIGKIPYSDCERSKDICYKRTGMIINQIRSITPEPDWKLHVVFIDGIEGVFDVNPYLADEAFEELKDIKEFMKVYNGRYYVEWDCGADLSADTLRKKIKRRIRKKVTGNR